MWNTNDVELLHLFVSKEKELLILAWLATYVTIIEIYIFMIWLS